MVRRHRRRDGWWTLDVSNEEFHDIHHALRQLAMVDSFQERITNSAAQMWNAHCARSEQRRLGLSRTPKRIETVAHGGFIGGFLIPVLFIALVTFVVLRLT